MSPSRKSKVGFIRMSVSRISSVSVQFMRSLQRDRSWMTLVTPQARVLQYSHSVLPIDKKEIKKEILCSINTRVLSGNQLQICIIFVPVRDVIIFNFEKQCMRTNICAKMPLKITSEWIVNISWESLYHCHPHCLKWVVFLLFLSVYNSHVFVWSVG